MTPYFSKCKSIGKTQKVNQLEKLSILFPIDLLFEPFFQKQQFPIDLLFGLTENCSIFKKPGK